MEEGNTNHTSPVYPAENPRVDKPKKTIPPFIGIVIIVLVAIILFGGVYLYQNYKIGPGLPPENFDWSKVTRPNTTDLTAGWKTYTNTQYGFEVKYPEKAVVEAGISSAEVNSKWYKIKVPTTSNAEAVIMISFPQGERCGAYGPGVASERVSEEIVFNTKKYNFGGWVEDAENYIKWADENPQYGGVTPRKTDPNYKRYYQKTMTVCGETFQANYSISFENLLNQNDLIVVEKSLTQILSTFKFTTPINQDFSALNKDVLLHKLFPNLTFSNGVANLPGGLGYENLKLYLKNSTEDYFINNQEKSLLLTVQLDGVAHAGGLYHAYLGLFDAKGDLLTPSSSFGSADINSYDFFTDKAQFWADQGQFGFYDCNGIKYISFISHACPNGGCCRGDVKIFKVESGVFKNIQIVDAKSLGNIRDNLSIKGVGDKIIIYKVPETSNTGCPVSSFKELNWDNNSCTFK